MEEVVRVGLDIAKSVFQVHGVGAEGRVVLQRRRTRARLIPFFEKLPRCRVGIEACATAHHWGRRLIELGHEVKLMPPSYVKPYVKRQKNDVADAEAIIVGDRAGLQLSVRRNHRAEDIVAVLLERGAGAARVIALQLRRRLRREIAAARLQ